MSLRAGSRHLARHKGAPFYDDNRNGVMDAGEQPGLLDADQVVWLVANDLDSTKTPALHGSPPIGIEMRVTLWAYRDDPNLENTIFRCRWFTDTIRSHRTRHTPPIFLRCQPCATSFCRARW